MIVNLPVIYRGEWFQEKKGRWLEKVFAHMEPREIRTMDGDCEVAARGVDVGLEDPAEILVHEGGLWVRESDSPGVRSRAGGTGGEAALQERRFAELDPREAATFLFRCHAPMAVMAGRPDFWTGNFRRHWKNCLAGRETRPNPAIHTASRNVGLAEARACAQEMAASLRLLDGHLYRRIVRPAFSVDSTRKVSVHLDLHGDVGSLGSFSLDREEDVREFLEGAFGGDGTMCEAPEILMPRAFAWPDEEESFALAAEFAMEKADRFWQEPGDLGEAGVSMFVAARALHERPDAGSLEGFVAAMKVLGKALCASGPSSRGESARLMRRKGEDTLAAVWRWNSRPIGHDRDVDAATAVMTAGRIERVTLRRGFFVPGVRPPAGAPG